MPSLFVDAHELAERIDVPYATVLRWTRRGRIPHVRDSRNRLLFNLDSVLVALREGVRSQLAPLGD
jgi:excisionase family DNA binding protein